MEIEQVQLKSCDSRIVDNPVGKSFLGLLLENGRWSKVVISWSVAATKQLPAGSPNMKMTQFTHLHFHVLLWNILEGILINVHTIWPPKLFSYCGRIYPLAHLLTTTCFELDNVLPRMNTNTWK